GTTQTSASYSGSFGHQYGFFSVASDNLGNRQPTPSAAQATVWAVSPYDAPALNYLTTGYTYAYFDYPYGSENGSAYAAFLYSSYDLSFAQLATATHSAVYWYDAYYYASLAANYAYQDYMFTGNAYASYAFVWEYYYGAPYAYAVYAAYHG